VKNSPIYGLRSSASWSGLSRHADLLLVALVVAVIMLMVLPLPPVILDSLIAINLTISVVLLMVALYISSPLGLSTFPSLLLFTTLFRLALNIASTRQILLNAYAGDIIATFGKMVVGGDVIVGAVVFLIIAIVQFIVVAKGSERVAEVAARFSLDAMPGKQMSIDADLRAGIIDKDEARQRRAKLESESQLYGAMDGGMKFVKGDAIAGLIIAAVNILAGLAIGVFRKGMDVGTALQTYAVLTVGDALVSQIPSLFVSIAAGIVITRVSDPGRVGSPNLGNEIAGQLSKQPKALLVGGAVIFLLILVPGFPKFQFLLLGITVTALGFFLAPARRRYANAAQTPMPSMQKEGHDVTRTLLDGEQHTLTIPLVVQAFPGIDTVLSPARFEIELAEARHYFSVELGIPFPGVVMREDERMAQGDYRVYVDEIPVLAGQLAGHEVLSLESGETLDREGIGYRVGSVPILGRGALWIAAEDAGALDAAKLAYLGNEQILARTLLNVLRRHAGEFIGIQETQYLLKRLGEQYPDLDKELQRNVPLPRLAEVLRRLVRDDISIRNLRVIAQALIEWAPREKDTVLLTEYVRIALTHYISHRYALEDGSLPAIVLHPRVEEQLRQALRQTSAGAVLMLDPEIGNKLVAHIQQAVEADVEKPAVLLTSLEIRPYLRKLTETQLPDLAVLSYQELKQTVRVDPVSSVDI
jgi:type III secretion protein V